MHGDNSLVGLRQQVRLLVSVLSTLSMSGVFLLLCTSLIINWDFDFLKNFTNSWRHHTNPVGTEWRWKVDDPEFILEGALDNHYGMLKQLKGVPGVRADRFVEANQVKHCALSLVGEPIFVSYSVDIMSWYNEFCQSSPNTSSLHAS